MQRRLLARQAPVVEQFRLVKRSPLDYHAKHSRRESALQYPQRRDFNDGPLLAIANVEVGRWVIVIVHRDDDTKETTYFRHRDTRTKRMAASPAIMDTRRTASPRVEAGY